ncbi:hypothetical protein J4438_03995 [Candidatus Woesearchaeota archaeon]|nr:hypothetical protein [Candidatus Woesearchaeota archaeon]
MEYCDEVAEIIGAHIGDGWIESRGNALYIAGHKEDDKDYYDNHLCPLFSKYFSKVKPRNFDYWSVYGFNLYKKEIIDKIIELGVKKGKKTLIVEFPSWIFFKKEFMIGALRGLFDTDGNFHCKKCYGKYDNNFRKKYHCQPRIEIVSTSKQLIIQVENILREIGFHPGMIMIKKANNKNGKNNSESYKIRIDRLNEIKKWFEELKLSSNPKHISKYYIWREFRFCPPKLTPEERKQILINKIDPYFYYN